MEVPNMVMKFQNCLHFCYILDLSSALAWRVVNIKGTHTYLSSSRRDILPRFRTTGTTYSSNSHRRRNLANNSRRPRHRHLEMTSNGWGHCHGGCHGDTTTMLPSLLVRRRHRETDGRGHDAVGHGGCGGYHGDLGSRQQRTCPGLKFKKNHTCNFR